MTRDDIIRMAVECQLVTTANRDGIYIEALERFAELVAAAEREALASDAESLGKGIQDYNKFASDLMIEYAAAIRARDKQ